MKQLLFLLCLVSIIAACKDDACDSANCQNGQPCSTGVCLCDYDVYDGERCEIENRTKFYGRYTGTFTEPTLGSWVSTVTLSKHASDEKRINMLILDGTDDYLVIDGFTRANIPAQSSSDGGSSVTISGEAFIEDKLLTVYLTEGDNGTTYNVKFVGTKP